MDRLRIAEFRGKVKSGGTATHVIQPETVVREALARLKVFPEINPEAIQLAHQRNIMAGKLSNREPVVHFSSLTVLSRRTSNSALSALIAAVAGLTSDLSFADEGRVVSVHDGDRIAIGLFKRHVMRFVLNSLCHCG